MVKNLPANVGDMSCRFDFLGQEEFLEERMAIHSSTLTWRNLMGRGALQATMPMVAESSKTE